MNSFEKWVAAQGGAEKVGPLLGVTPHAVRYWLRGYSMPRSETIRKIGKLTKGRVRISHIYDLQK